MTHRYLGCKDVTLAPSYSLWDQSSVLSLSSSWRAYSEKEGDEMCSLSVGHVTFWSETLIICINRRGQVSTWHRLFLQIDLVSCCLVPALNCQISSSPLHSFHQCWVVTDRSPLNSDSWCLKPDVILVAQCPSVAQICTEGAFASRSQACFLGLFQILEHLWERPA